jgi:hypothetical protein
MAAAVVLYQPPVIPLTDRVYFRLFCLEIHGSATHVENKWALIDFYLKSQVLRLQLHFESSEINK